MERHDMIAISTAHISRETANLLDQLAAGKKNIEGLVVYNKGEYGWFIPIIEEELETLENNECPGDLFHCLSYAHKNGGSWVMFDRDVELSTPDLAPYPWEGEPEQEKTYKLHARVTKEIDVTREQLEKLCNHYCGCVEHANIDDIVELFVEGESSGGYEAGYIPYEWAKTDILNSGDKEIIDYFNNNCCDTNDLDF